MPPANPSSNNPLFGLQPTAAGTPEPRQTAAAHPSAMQAQVYQPAAPTAMYAQTADQKTLLSQTMMEASAAIERTQHMPGEQLQALASIKARYIKARYDIDVKVVGGQAG